MESTKVPLRLAHNTPLVFPLPRFINCTEALNIHPATASILDDMRFLISTVLALPVTPSPKELQKVHTTSIWIQDRILNLPDYSPVARYPSEADQETVAFAGKGVMDIGISEADDDEISVDVQQGSAVRLPVDINTGIQWRRRDAPPAVEPPDFLYRSVRLAALMYSRAVIKRRPFSSVVAQADFLGLWTTMWRVPLTTWKGVLGVFNWAILPIAPAASGTAHARSVKSMLATSTLQIGLDNWGLATGGMEAGLRLQRWLGRETDGMT